MADARDPAIKLFGKTIPLPDTPPSPAATSSPTRDVSHVELASPHNHDDSGDGDGGNINSNHDELNHIPTADEATTLEEVTTQERDCDKGDQDGQTCHVKPSGLSPQSSDKSTCQEPSLATADNPDSLSSEKSAVESSKTQDEKTETSVSQEKTLKKPDKILPCPRCNSMDTKFCYYNNYNVNQPRHFCKNCQRYWTAGGTMRNVPVGAGRRKNKSSASHCRHITVPEALQNVRTDTPNGVHPGLQTNGTVLTFGSDGPLCESMASILNLAEKTMRNCAPNGCQKAEDLEIPMPFVAMETTGNHLEGSDPKEDASKSTPKEPAAQNCGPFPQIPCYPGAPWPYPWNSGQWSPPVAAPPFCPSGFAIPFYPAPAYWGCTVPGTWSIPLITQPSPSSQLSPSSSPNSPTLGKHSRDGNVLTLNGSEEKEKDDTNCERSLWIPKTLRIDDPGEAAKSSIWTTLGIKNNEKLDSIGRGSGIFKAFNSKCNEGSPNMETTTVLEANPAALSRSQNFQENS